MPIRKVSFENPHFTGTEAAKMPEGTNAQRANAVSGDQRFNTDTSLMEYYDGAIWKPIDSPPVVASISPTAVDESDTTTTITVTGDRFGVGASVSAIGQDSSIVNANSTTRNSATSLTAVFTSANFDNAQEPYTIKVLNQSGLSAQFADSLQVNASPVWSSAAAPTSLGNVQDTSTGTALTLSATDSEGSTLTYAETTSNLTPYGLTLNANGTVSGTVVDQTADTNVTFTATASDGSNTVSRNFAFNILKTYDGSSSSRAFRQVPEADGYADGTYWIDTVSGSAEQLTIRSINGYAYALAGTRYQSTSTQTSVNTNGGIGTPNAGTSTFLLSTTKINYMISANTARGFGMMVIPQQASGVWVTSNNFANLYRQSSGSYNIDSNIFTDSNASEGSGGTSAAGIDLSSFNPDSDYPSNWYGLETNTHEGGNQILSKFGGITAVSLGGIGTLPIRWSNNNGAGYHGGSTVGNDVTGSARNLSDSPPISLFLFVR